MATQFTCELPRRREAVRQQNALNGIDYLEVTAQDQTQLAVHFIHPLPGQTNAVPDGQGPLRPANIRIEGGERVRNIRVTAAESSGNVLAVTVDTCGDFSTYTLRLVTSVTDSDPPGGLDPQLSAIDFSFKVTCPSDFDCQTQVECPPESIDEPTIDYLAKDYTSFRRLMLDRMGSLLPAWQDRNPADVQVALVEMLAYVGDHLSYYQDAVATEAYLGTARRRTSVRRHARLLDYAMHDGCNARAWVHLEVAIGGVADGGTLPSGTSIRTPGAAPVVFETMHELKLRSQHNQLEFYTWSDDACCLPQGSTRATLQGNNTRLQPGDVLVFEEIISPMSGRAADADPDHRCAVRLIEVTQSTDPLNATSVVEIAWHSQDALPFPLCLSARVVAANGQSVIKRISIARGNIVLADQGQTHADETLQPAVVPATGRYRPHLQHRNISFAAPYTHEQALRASATQTIRQTPHTAQAEVGLHEDTADWSCHHDLLNSGRFATEFVVETENDDRAWLRFGDGTQGRRPVPGTAFQATYRTGNGPTGNVGADTLTVCAVDGIVQVRNPLPATGGSAPESMEAVRRYAPQAFRTQQRAVTEADYASAAERHPEVQKAAARFRWTGSWYTAFVTIDRKGGRTIRDDPQFEHAIRAHLDYYRLAGYDLEINDPIAVTLDLKLDVCVAPGHFASEVKRSLLQTFSRFDLPGGGRGFFHPDNFTFGQTLYLSAIYAAALAVSGVTSVNVVRFKRWHKKAVGEREAGELTTAALEVIRLDNDPSAPEHGRIEFAMRGGI